MFDLDAEPTERFVPPPRLGPLLEIPAVGVAPGDLLWMDEWGFVRVERVGVLEERDVVIDALAWQVDEQGLRMVPVKATHAHDARVRVRRLGGQQ